MKKTTILAALVAALAVATSAQAAQFVVNGDFSQLSHGLGLIGPGGSTTATGWTTTGYNLVLDNATDTVSTVALWDSSNKLQGDTNTWNGLAPGGTGNFAALDGDYSTGPLSQTITGLVVGATYTLSFDYAFAQQESFDGATIQSLSASFGGTQVFNSGNYNLPSHGFSGWNVETLTLTPTSPTEVLSFLAAGNLPIPPFSLLTDVSLTGPVPEPATWAMMIVGLGLIGAAVRRRRPQPAAA